MAATKLINKNIVICGSTCSGKSELALELAQKLSAVIINADSQQVYSDLQILSARPSAEEEKLAPHHLYGALPAEEICNAVKWLKMVRDLKIPSSTIKIFVGGTGLYLNSLWQGMAQIPEVPQEVRAKVRAMSKQELESALGAEADGNTQRMMRALEVKLATGKSIKDWHNEPAEADYTPEELIIIYKNVSRETLYDKINVRFIWQLDNGAIEEVKKLAAKNLSANHSIMKALGVPEIIEYLNGNISLTDAITKAQQKIRNYAKRQQTWFKHQLPAHTIDTINMSKDEIYEAVLKQGR